MPARARAAGGDESTAIPTAMSASCGGVWLGVLVAGLSGVAEAGCGRVPLDIVNSRPDAARADRGSVGRGRGDDAQTGPGVAARDGADDVRPGRDRAPIDCGMNPAASCKALLAALPAAGSGSYVVSATGHLADAFSTFCDMATAGGGWTKVTRNIPASQVDLLRGPAGRQMLKCSDSGSEHIISRPFAIPWSWSATRSTGLPGPGQ